ncbi:hypothetical protein RQP46_005052 [Phenoliferia psychrophenolica]
MLSKSICLALLSLGVQGTFAKASRPAVGLARRNGTSGAVSEAFAFTNIVTATATFTDGLTATIPSVTGGVLTNGGTQVSTPVSGSVTVANTTYSLTSVSLTAPAVFTLDGEWYPAALRLNFKEGPSLAFLFILTPDEPNTPFVNTILDAVGSIPATGGTTTLGSLDFGFFIDTYITPDIFYKESYGGKDFFVRQLPLSMELVKWRALKKVLTVS